MDSQSTRAGSNETINNNDVMQQLQDHGEHTAMHAVLGTTELLEMILLRLPPRDIIVSMRVCKPRNDCVHASPTIAQRLFIRPSGMQVRLVDFPAWTEDDNIAASYATFAPTATWSDKAFPPDSSDESEPLEPYTPVRLCPLLHLDRAEMSMSTRLFASADASDCASPIVPHRIGPWSAMFLTEPPCVMAIMYVELQHCEHEGLVISAERCVFNAQGVTFRDILEQVPTNRDPTDCRFPEEWGDDIEMWPTEGQRRWEDSLIDEVVKKVTDCYGGRFEVSVFGIGLIKAVVPDEKEWELVERRKA